MIVEQGLQYLIFDPHLTDISHRIIVYLSNRKSSLEIEIEKRGKISILKKTKRLCGHVSVGLRLEHLRKACWQ